MQREIDGRVTDAEVANLDVGENSPAHPIALELRSVRAGRGGGRGGRPSRIVFARGTRREQRRREDQYAKHYAKPSNHLISPFSGSAQQGKGQTSEAANARVRAALGRFCCKSFTTMHFFRIEAGRRISPGSSTSVRKNGPARRRAVALLLRHPVRNGLSNTKDRIGMGSGRGSQPHRAGRRGRSPRDRRVRGTSSVGTLDADDDDDRRRARSTAASGDGRDLDRQSA